ncbi:MAG: SHOCT domain-containing protein [Promethearchaeota archaeon]
MAKTKDCPFCSAPIIPESQICPYCKQPLVSGFQITESVWDPMNAVIQQTTQQVNAAIAAAQAQAAQQRAQAQQKKSGFGKFLKGALSLAGGLGSIGDTIQNITEKGANLKNVVDLAAKTAKTVSAVTGKGKNVATALGGISGITSSIQNIQSGGLTPQNFSNLATSTMKTIAGATGHSKEFKAMQNIQNGIMSGDPMKVAKGMGAFKKSKKPAHQKSSNTTIEAIKKLKELYDMNIISKEEFERKKQDLLNKL